MLYDKGISREGSEAEEGKSCCMTLTVGPDVPYSLYHPLFYFRILFSTPVV
jgi:hypothetical protein